ncbi:hypothetical protein HG1285_11907, partial [Hydrogenivirga sp. 128-5-R1-1]
YKKPVIATGYSGQTYFCNEDTAFLIDYTFEPSKSHVSSPFSYWVNPKKEDLIEKMLFIYKNKDSQTVKQKVENAYNLIKTKFTWETVANKLEEAIKYADSLPVFLDKKINLAWISTFNTKCGIATYSQFLIDNLPDFINPIKIANKIQQEEILNQEEEKNINRLWSFGLSDTDIKNLTNFIDKNADAILIQHHFAFFDTNQFGKLLQNLNKLNKPIFITFHSTYTDIKKYCLSNIKNQLKLATRIFVHNIQDLNI